MRRLFLATVLVLLAVSPAQAQQKETKWDKAAPYIMVAGQGADLLTTYLATRDGRFGEGNPLLATSDGRPNWKVIIPLKVGLCSLTFLLPRKARTRVQIGAGLIGADAAGVNLAVRF